MLLGHSGKEPLRRTKLLKHSGVVSKFRRLPAFTIYIEIIRFIVYIYYFFVYAYSMYPSVAFIVSPTFPYLDLHGPYL